MPSSVQEVDGTACQALRRVFVSGEALPPTSVTKFLEVLPDAQLHNLYGPTEATVDVTGGSSKIISSMHCYNKQTYQMPHQPLQTMSGN